jgi:predicted PurR-regulated permease PerM
MNTRLEQRGIERIVGRACVRLISVLVVVGFLLLSMMFMRGASTSSTPYLPSPHHAIAANNTMQNDVNPQ